MRHHPLVDHAKRRAPVRFHHQGEWFDGTLVGVTLVRHLHATVLRNGRHYRVKFDDVIVKDTP